MSDFRIDGSWFDCFDSARINAVARANKMPMPRYHLVDGEPPRVLDIEEEYPRAKYGKLKFIYDRGYIWVGTADGVKLFESNHCCDYKREPVQEYVDYLIKLRTKDWFKPDIERLSSANTSVLIYYDYLNDAVADATIEALQEHFGEEFERFTVKKEISDMEITIRLVIDNIEMYGVRIEKELKDE